MAKFGKKPPDRLANRLSTLKTAATGAPAPKFVSSRKQRAHERRTTYKFGRVLSLSREEHSCIVKDLSVGGARIILEGAFSLPEKVTLKIDQTGSTQAARVVWQIENEAGLAFLPGLQATI